MANNVFKAKMDLQDVFRALDQLAGPVKESLGRRMGVEGGVLLRDQAKAKAMQADNKKGVARRGRLAGSIYLAHDAAFRPGSGVIRYVISWNAKVAPHGHLIEFGHWRYNKIVNGRPQKSLRDGLRKGKGPEDHVPPGALVKPEWVRARPFLRPTIDNYGSVAITAMIKRGQKEFPILLAEINK